MLELSDQEFERAMMNMLRALMDKADRVKEHTATEAERWKF